MEAIFGSNANVKSMAELNSTQGGGLMYLEITKSEENLIKINDSDSDSGLSAYEVQAKKREKQESKWTKGALKDGIPKDRNNMLQLDINKKNELILTKNKKPNFKEAHTQEQQAKRDLKVKALDKIMTINTIKSTVEKGIANCQYELAKEKFDWKLNKDTEEKQIRKEESERKYSFQKEKISFE
ncbi:hypothetical protein O181_125681 [Austropuccinia psidii MF-1]|uniref:Uncharacterized protein n=1 Tax=Austropuccinia psidii MF-1 TaxID=1389203 RepID=A0A9Q3Q594_9BASI|nr:hypothetical protein [Austropuccinia psidii MF-1]